MTVKVTNLEQIKTLHEEFMSKLIPLVKESENVGNTALGLLSATGASLLSISAMTSGIMSHPEYDVKQRMVYMGNQAIVHAIEQVEASGNLTSMRVLSELLNDRKTNPDG
jgi:hypothetical protein